MNFSSTMGKLTQSRLNSEISLQLKFLGLIWRCLLQKIESFSRSIYLILWIIRKANTLFLGVQRVNLIPLSIFPPLRRWDRKESRKWNICKPSNHIRQLTTGSSFMTKPTWQTSADIFSLNSFDCGSYLGSDVSDKPEHLPTVSVISCLMWVTRQSIYRLCQLSRVWCEWQARAFTDCVSYPGSDVRDFQHAE
jgi:hypothetical protein